MKKLAIGLLAAVLFAFFSYGAIANCGKCGHGPAKCDTQSSQAGCKMAGDKSCCSTEGCCKKADGKSCGCCDKCAKGECCCKDGKKCCEKCACPCCADKGSCKMKAADPTEQEVSPDPVCGMDVNTKDSKITYEYKGKTYHFCNESCKERFVKDPSKFIGD